MLGKDYFQGNMIKHSISVHEMLQDDASLVYRTPTSRSYVIYDMLNSQRSRQNMVSWRRLLLIASTAFVWTDHHRHLPSLPSSSKINSSSFSMPQIFPPGFFRPTVGSSQISVIWPSISTTKAQQLGVSSASTRVPLSNDVTLGFECHDGILLFAWFVEFVGLFLRARVPNPDQLGWNASRCPQEGKRKNGSVPWWNWTKMMNIESNSFANEISTAFTKGSCPEPRPMRFANSRLVHTHWLLRWMTRRHPKSPQGSNLGGLQNIWKFSWKDRSLIHWSILFVNLFRISWNIFEPIWVHSILEISEACLEIILSINWINSYKIIPNPFLSQSSLNLHWSPAEAPHVAPVAASPSAQQQQKTKSQQFRKNPKPRSKILRPRNRSEDFTSSSHLNLKVMKVWMTKWRYGCFQK